jgi:acyl carrier protein
MAREPFMPTEETVVSIWTRVLRIRPTSRDDDFFDLGGTSFGLMEFLQQVSDEYGVELDMGELFESDFTVGVCARAIDRARGVPAVSP